MGKEKSSPPPQPSDPAATARAQTGSNVDTAITQAAMNNTNQITPYGSVKYTVTGAQHISDRDIPTYTATTTLSPEQQKLYDTQTRVTQGAYDLADKYTGRIGDATAKPYGYEGLPGAPTYNEDYRKKQLGAIEARNQPQMDRDRGILEQRLADQGIGIQDPAYRTAWDQHQRGVNDFRLGADVQAGNAASQQYGLEANTRDRAIQEMTNLRTQPINEVGALLGTGSVRDPTFINTPQTQVQPTDVAGIYANSYQQQLAQQQMQMQQQNAGMGGLFGLGSAALMAGGMYYGGGRK